MKYIRFKNKIFQYDTRTKKATRPYSDFWIIVEKKDYDKIADTIEKLCDEFVVKLQDKDTIWQRLAEMMTVINH